ncbi:hypothetical protein MMC30_002410 [Trapelia coarctata]|nr:hypothetical protein [Trapelia coarctata]
MGWLWGSSKDGGSGSSTNDPLKDLDPSLREFLEKESPVKYKTAQAPAPPPSIPAPSNSNASTQTTTVPAANNTNGAAAPSQSLFPDGRYAHLWSTYKPLSDVENATKTDQEKLLDVLEGFKERKAQIGRAAVENCVMEQWAINDCYNNGGWKSRMTMCRAENREFERCYNMQSRFLKALGYLSNYDRPPEVDEQIQMHADTLYHRMLERERAVEEAKAAGLPIPTFPDILSSSKSTPSTTTQMTPPASAENPVPLPPDLEGLKPKVKAQLRDRLKDLSPEERALEEKALAMEIAAGKTVGKQIDKMFEDQAKAKKLRKEQGKETFGDKISSLFGW